ncbi:MAG: hypothetical protein QOK15_1127 [Nocardioidaceae bacterium]|nr:hypothetical protein [Nocardioidaceae bacterium]
MSGATYERQRLLEDFFRACNDSEIRWVLLRGRVTLTTPGKDVDVLLDPAHKGLFEEVVRSVGGVVQPGRLHPSHQTYRIGRPLKGAIPLDAVTRLAYGRDLQLESHLESGCLDRRVRSGWLYELDPTDLFWTVLLHCLFDKWYFTERRIDELRSSLPLLVRQSEAERFTVGLLPADWSANRVVETVGRGDFEAFEALAAQLSPQPHGSAVRRNPRWGLDATAAKVYNRLWLTAGFGAPVHVDSVLDAAAVTSVVTAVHRRPRLIEVTVDVPAPERPAAEAALAAAGYRQVRERWSRLRRTGLESVRTVTGAWSAESGRASSRTLPLGGRQHCRWAVLERGPAEETVGGAP